VRALTYFTLIFVLLACGDVRRVDTTEVKKIMQKSKIQKITESEFANLGNEAGAEIYKEFSEGINLECQDQYIYKGKQIELFDIDETDYLKKIKNPKQKELLEAYDFGLKNNQAPGNNIQKINDSTYIFTFAFEKTSDFNKKCGKEIGVIYLKKEALMESIYQK
jgi:hypothetical protein